MPATNRDTRGQILDIARELFVEQGFSGTSLREIADRMNFTKAALYYHFRTKDDLLVELLEPLMQSSERVLDEHGDNDARELVAAYLDEVLIVHQDTLGVFANDPAVIQNEAIGPRVIELGDRLVRSLAASEDPADVLRAQTAVALLHNVNHRMAVDDPELRRRVLVPAALAVLDSGS